MWISKKKYEYYERKIKELDSELSEKKKILKSIQDEKNAANITCTGCEYLITDERNTSYGKVRQFYCRLRNKCPDFK